MTVGDVQQWLSRPLEIARAVEDLDDLTPLDSYAGAVAAAAGTLLDEGADVLDVTRAIADANDALTRRLLVLAEARLGPPPFAYAWLALGSHGRGEQVLSSDQDSALVYAGPRLGAGDPEDHFARLAAPVVEALARAGIRPCSGEWMATRWHLHVDELERRFAAWVADTRPEHMLGTEIFLDLRPVHGDLDVTGLAEGLVAGARGSAYLRQLAAATLTFQPPVVALGRIRTDHGRLDLKRSGTAAVVLMARLHALAAGASPLTTEERLRAAAEAGTLSADGAERLLDAYRTMTRLRLGHQVSQARRGEEPDDLVRPADLTAADRRALRRAIRDLRVVQQVIAERYRTHALG